MVDDKMADSGQSLWTNPEWLAEVKAWLATVLTQQGNWITADPRQIHIRPWSTVLRVPTDTGDVYFKAIAPGLGQETAVTQALFRWQPDCIPQVLNADSERSWLLLTDGGQRLREQFQGGLPMSAWHNILGQYATLQVDLVKHVDELLALGTRDRRLSLLPSLYEALLVDTECLLLDEPNGLTTAEYERLRQALPHVTALCKRLNAFAIPESLHHNDLHDANIFVKNGRTFFFDWGDASIAHPFFSLRTVFVSMEIRFNLAENDPALESYAHSYLQSWRQFASEADLLAAYQIARRLWSISSAIKYKTFLSLIPEARADNAHAVPGLLQELLEANADW